MSDDVEFLSLIHEGEILAACRALYPTTHSVLNIQAARTTPPVPGFTSLMLRVCVTARSTDGTDTKVTLIYKNPSIIPQQQEVMGGLELFHREVAYYRDAVPLLQRRCPNLPLVKCYYSQNVKLIMEDLDLAGYSSIIHGISKTIGSTITIAHVKLVVRSLARLHVASLGIDWPAILPQLETDAYYDSEIAKVLHCVQNLLQPAMARSSKCVAMAMQIFSNSDTSWNLIARLQQPDYLFMELSKLARFVPGQVNVLCHGDVHANNMMFKHDEQGNPTEVKFLDLQIFRYAPPSRDLLYFLYASTSHKFRQQYEREVLQTYVEAFNAAACTTPDLLNLDTFLADYEAARIFGAGSAINMLQMIASVPDETFLNPGDPMTSENFEVFMHAPKDPTAADSTMLLENLTFREAMLQLGEEIFRALDKL